MSALESPEQLTSHISPEQREQRLRAAGVIATWLSTLSLTDMGAANFSNGETVPLHQIADTVYHALQNGQVFFVVDDKLSADKIGLRYPMPLKDITVQFEQMTENINAAMAKEGDEREKMLAQQAAAGLAELKNSNLHVMAELVAFQVSPSITLSDCMKEKALNGLVQVYLAHREKPIGLYSLTKDQIIRDIATHNRCVISRIDATDPSAPRDPRFGPFPEIDELP